MTGIVLKMVFLFLLCCGTHCQVLVSLLSDVITHFFSGCVYLVHDERDFNVSENSFNLKDMIDIQKGLSIMNAQTTVLAISKFVSTMKILHCNNNSPIYIFLCSETVARPVLSQVGTDLWGPIWLLLLPPGDTPVEGSLSGVDVPIGCEFLIAWKPREQSDYHIIEVFRVTNEGPLQTNQYGKWLLNSGPQGWPDLELWKRRNDLKGHTFQATTIQTYEETEIGGSIGQLWKLLEHQMNFKTRVISPLDKAWGSVDHEGQWNGMVAMLQKREVDVAVDSLIMTSDRSLVMDFTTPILLTRYYMYVKEPRTLHRDWFSHIRPFSTQLWMIILLMMTIVACSLHLHHTLFRSTFSAIKKLSKVAAVNSNPSDQESLILRMFSRRLMMVTTFLTYVVLVAAYSGTLTSFLTIQKLKMPFTNFWELLESGFVMDVVRKSAEYNYFTNSKNELIKNMYNKMLVPHEELLPPDEKVGLQTVCVKDKRVLIANSVFGDEAIAEANCSLISIPADMVKGTMSLGLVKDSPYRGITNYNINMLRSTGILRRLLKRSITNSKASETEVPEVDVDKVIPLFFELMVGIMTAILFLVTEIIVSRLYSVVQNNVSPRRRKNINNGV